MSDGEFRGGWPHPIPAPKGKRITTARYGIRCNDCGAQWSASADSASGSIVEHNDQCDSQFEAAE